MKKLFVAWKLTWPFFFFFWCIYCSFFFPLSAILAALDGLWFARIVGLSLENQQDLVHFHTATILVEAFLLLMLIRAFFLFLCGLRSSKRIHKQAIVATEGTRSSLWGGHAGVARERFTNFEIRNYTIIKFVCWVSRISTIQIIGLKAL